MRLSACACVILVAHMFLSACRRGGEPVDETCEAPGLYCPATSACVGVDLDAICTHDGGRCASLESVILDENCAPSCTRCEEVYGEIATYLSAASGPDGTLHVAGYAPGSPQLGRYGDLVYGTLGAGAPAASIAWTVVDGLPPDANGAGFRRGATTPGPDVGLWTSLALADAAPSIAYYDRSSGALKYARRDAAGWSVHVVSDEGDVGAYASLLIGRDGRPRISAHSSVASNETSGAFVSRVVVFTSAIAQPTQASDWTMEIAAAAPSDCEPRLCASGQTCFVSGRCLAATNDCGDTCESGATCLDGTCEPHVDPNAMREEPRRLGIHTRLAQDSLERLALVYTDGATGTLYGAQRTTTFGPPFVIDGGALGGLSPTRSGSGASLFVDANDRWHVAYVDHARSRVRYARVENGTVAQRATADDGGRDASGSYYPDGRHVVGGTTSVLVTSAGRVRIAYQDLSTQHAWLAERSVDGDFVRSVRDTSGLTGFWTAQVPWSSSGTGSTLVTHWRGPVGARHGGVHVVEVP